MGNVSVPALIHKAQRWEGDFNTVNIHIGDLLCPVNIHRHICVNILIETLNIKYIALFILLFSGNK